jgi:hypothetical protein
MTAHNAHPTTRPAPLTPEQEEAIYLLTSRLAGERVGRPMLYQQMRALVGQFEPPPTLPIAKRVMRERRLRREDIDRDWTVAELSTGKLDRDLVEAFIPREIWPFIWEAIRIGPVSWAYGFERLMRLWAVGAEVDGSRRLALAASTLNTYITTQYRFARRVIELRTWAAHHNVQLPDEFAQWVKDELPTFKWGDGYGGVITFPTTKAPHLLHVRRALHGLDQRVRTQRRRKSTHGKRALKWRALLGTVASTGARASTLAELKVDDFLPAYRFPDGTVGPALRYTYIKGRPGVVRVQGVPETVGEWISEHIRVNRVGPGSLWGGVDSEKGRSAESLSETVATVMAEFADPGDDDRYASHDLRRIAERYARRFGDQLFVAADNAPAEEGVVGSPADGQTLANLLTDHAPRTVDATYKDLLNANAVEHWARVAALGVWEYVWGDRGARRVPDIEAITQAHERLVDARANRAVAERSLAELKERRAQLRATRGSTLAVSTSEPTEIADALLALMRYADEIEHVADLLVDVSADLASAVGAVDDAERNLERALAIRVPVDDFASAEELAELAEIAESYALAPGDPEAPAPAIRRSFTTREMAWATGLSVAQMKRFFIGQGNFTAIFDHTASGRPLGVERVSERRQFANFDELPLHRYPARIIERLQWLMRQPHGCLLPGRDAEFSGASDARDLHATLTDSYTTPQVAELLGVSRPTPRNRWRAGKLLATEDEHMLLFPKWQFHGAAVVAGLAECLARLSDLDDGGKAEWFVTSDPALSGRTPASCLQAGEADRVLRHVKSRAKLGSLELSA